MPVDCCLAFPVVTVTASCAVSDADAASDAVAACCWNLYLDQAVAVSTAAAACCCRWLLLSKFIVFLLSRCWPHTAVLPMLMPPPLPLLLAEVGAIAPGWLLLLKKICPLAGLLKQSLLAHCVVTAVGTACHHCATMLLPLPLLILLAINCYFAVAVAITIHALLQILMRPHCCLLSPPPIDCCFIFQICCGRCCRCFLRCFHHLSRKKGHCISLVHDPPLQLNGPLQKMTA